MVYGTVQGVFFRDSCRREARRRHIAGWVANRDDGSVEAVFEGEPAEVAAMLDWVKQGPPRARVERVDVTTEEPQAESSFRVVSSRS